MSRCDPCDLLIFLIRDLPPAPLYSHLQVECGTKLLINLSCVVAINQLPLSVECSHLEQ